LRIKRAAHDSTRSGYPIAVAVRIVFVHSCGDTAFSHGGKPAGQIVAQCLGCRDAADSFSNVGDAIERIPAVFDIDMSRCMFCGLCEEACPEEAIVMSRDVELATYERGAMLWHMKDLLRTEEQVARRLDLIRRDYVR